MGFVADDSVRTERKVHKFLERRQLAPIRVGGVSGWGSARLILPADPHDANPTVQPVLGSDARAYPRLVVAFAFLWKFDRPEPRGAVAVDHADQGARPCSVDHAPHRRRHNEMLLSDHAFDLVRVNLSTAAVGRVWVRAEKSFRLVNRHG